MEYLRGESGSDHDRPRNELEAEEQEDGPPEERDCAEDDDEAEDDPPTITAKGVPDLPDERILGPVGLASIIFFEVGGGIGMDEAVRHGSIFWTLLGIVIFPILFAIPLALVTAEMATSFPENGGQVAWVRCAFGHRMGFIQGTSSFLGNVMDIAALGVLAIDYLSALESNLDTTRARIGLGTCVVLIAGGINFKGTAILEKYSIAFAAIALLPLLAIVVLGSPEVNPAVWLHKRQISHRQLAKLVCVLFWNNSGYDLAGSCAGEVKNPSRVFPLALGIAVTVSTLCYLVPIAVAVCTHAGLDDIAWTDNYLSTSIAEELGGHNFKIFSCWCSAVSSVGMCCSAILSTSRELQYMATQNMVPELFVTLHPEHGTPQWCIAAICLGTAVAILLPFDPVVEASCFWGCTAYFIEFLAFVQLKMKVPTRSGNAFILPGGTIGALTIVTVPLVLCVFVLFQVSRWTILWGILTFAAAMVYYEGTHCSVRSVMPVPLR